MVLASRIITLLRHSSLPSKTNLILRNGAKRNLFNGHLPTPKPDKKLSDPPVITTTKVKSDSLPLKLDDKNIHIQSQVSPSNLSGRIANNVNWTSRLRNWWDRSITSRSTKQSQSKHERNQLYRALLLMVIYISIVFAISSIVYTPNNPFLSDLILIACLGTPLFFCLLL